MKTSSAKWFVGPLILCGLASIFILSAASAEDNHDDRGKSQISVHLWDYCDPTTFNMAFGAGTCDRDTSTGAITVNGFLGELSSEQSVGAWRYTPSEIKSDHRPLTLELKNEGGETHTFTRVKKFGGGFVDVLNQASGNPVPAPECAQFVNGVLTPQAPGPDNLMIPVGGTESASVPRRDQVRYQCCIHPWMRLVVGDNDDHGHDH